MNERDDRPGKLAPLGADPVAEGAREPAALGENAPSADRRRLIAALAAGTTLAIARRSESAPAPSGAAAPAFAAGAAAGPTLVDDLVSANHVLFHQGLVDAFGHVSARDPANPAHYWIARSIQPPLVSREDILELDADSRPVAEGAPDVPFERFIHGEIYRLRPDVKAIVHSHAAAVLPFSVVRDVPLRAICHTCGFIGQGAPVFDIRDVTGDGSNMLVQSAPLGAALAKTLDTHALVLMRGHGFTVVGGSIQEAVYNAINTVVNARVQGEAMRLGVATYLSDGEAAAVSRVHNASLMRSWELWVKQAAGELR